LDRRLGGPQIWSGRGGEKKVSEIPNFTCLDPVVHYLSQGTEKFHVNVARIPCYFALYQNISFTRVVMFRGRITPQNFRTQTWYHKLVKVIFMPGGPRSIGSMFPKELSMSVLGDLPFLYTPKFSV
jgi:hypothetical protein